MATVDTPESAPPASSEAEPFHRSASRRYLRTIASVCVTMLVVVVMAVLYLGQPVLLPLATALLLSFLLRPIARRLQRWHVPLPASAFLLVSLFAGILGLGIYSLGGPASEWLKDAPLALRQLQYRIADMKGSIEEVKQATQEVEKLGKVGERETPAVVVKGGDLSDTLLLQTQEAAVGMFTTLILLFFILGWGERLYRNVVNTLPRFHNQRQVVEIAQEIEDSVTKYLTTITVINLTLGVVVSGAMYVMEVPNPVLWGVVAALFNYVPYLGPAVTAVILGFVALLTFEGIGEALLVPAVFLTITSLEGYVITPLAVGSRLTLNPLIIFLSLVFWFWMWGIVGSLLTVPILVCIKVTLDRVGTQKTLARVLD
ncbi:MAG: AI-2E family transporter [Chromatocurvus sp.]